MDQGIATKIDREIEFSVNNLRAGVEDLLGVRKQTAKRILGALTSATDVFLNPGKFNVTILLTCHIFYLYIHPLFYGEKGASESGGGTKYVEDIDNIDIYIRLFNFLVFVNSLRHGEFYSLPFILYLAQKIHDDDDRGIKNWAKGQLKKLRESIKIPGLQPSPA